MASLRQSLYEEPAARWTRGDTGICLALLSAFLVSRWLWIVANPQSSAYWEEAYRWVAVESLTGVAVFAGIGERSREGLELWDELQRRQVMDRTVLVFGQMKEPPGARFLIGFAALAVAEHFRDHEGRDVLFVVDNVYRYVQAGMEVSGLLGRMPSRVGYQPTLATELAELEERIASSATGSMTSVQAVYVPADDLTDPSATHTFAHLSASIVLSRKRAAQGFYPAIDPLRSDSKMLTPTVVGERHYRVAQEARRVLAEFARLAPPARVPDESLPERLTEREREVLRLVARGLSNREIGSQLHLAEGTIKNHVTSILDKLGVRDRTQAALRAREMGWI